MKELLSDFQLAKQRLQELAETEEYQKDCQHFQSEVVRLTTWANSLLPRIPQLQEEYFAATTRREYASGCKYLHRGFYAPSPVIDQIIVNTKRGKLLKRLTARANPAFEYGFHQDGRLLWCRQLENRQPVSTEFLVYEDHAVYGILLDSRGALQTVTEELFCENERLRYTKAMFTPYHSQTDCFELSCEEYLQKDGKFYTLWHRFTPNTISFDPLILDEETTITLPSFPIYRCDLYAFEKKDGKWRLICE